MRQDYINRVNGFSDSFKRDILETLKRIDAKDGKAYPLRIQKSVAKRWANVPRYKVTLALQWMEYMGLLVCSLEPIEEYKARMKEHHGLYEKGLRRKYYKVNPKKPSESRGNTVEYEKLSYDQLGVEHTRLKEYPV